MSKRYERPDLIRPLTKHQRYYYANKDKYREWNKKAVKRYLANNRARRLETERNWRANHKETIAAGQRSWWAKNKSTALTRREGKGGRWGNRCVMRDDAVCFMNMGDSYASNWPCSRRSTIGNGSLENGKREARPPRLGENLKDKDLMGMPWRVAFALQDAGFWLRQDIIWSKPNPMPESVSDRCTKAHEYIFLLTKSAKYFYDAEAIKQPLSPKTLTVHTTPTKGNGTESTGEKLNTWMAANGGRQHPESANKRSVWTT
jgi:hypothetical protein